MNTIQHMIIGHRKLFSALALLIIAGVVSGYQFLADAPWQPQMQKFTLPLPIVTRLPSAITANEKITAIEPVLHESTDIVHAFKQGENLSLIFDQYQLPAGDLANILIADRAHRYLRTVRAKEQLQITTDTNQRVQRLVYFYNPLQGIVFERQGETRFSVTHYQAPHESFPHYVEGVIRSSLYEDAQQAGMRAAEIMDLYAIFAYDIDFAFQIQPGDRFRVLLEEHFRDGKKVDTSIAIAEFIVRGETFLAVRYEDQSGKIAYFTPSGEALQSRFLRMPLAFGRISSRFSLSRKHPILHINRPHTGVDYAAPHGTPILAVGHGTVTFIGTKGGYGETMMLDHGDGYVTLYAHMSRYAKGMRRGTRVRQGDTIGYVGSTGLSTGPHVHFEFRVHGQYRDPLTLRAPKGQRIASQYLQDFQSRAQHYLAALDTYKKFAVIEK